MRANVSPHVQVKAVGGVRNLGAALAVIDVGVTRIGASATAKILDEYQQVKEAGEPLVPDFDAVGEGY